MQMIMVSDMFRVTNHEYDIKNVTKKYLPIIAR